MPTPNRVNAVAAPSTESSGISLRKVVKLADGFVVEVELLAPDVEEQLRCRAVGAQRFDGEVVAAEPAVVDARADADRSRGVDVEVGHDVRAVRRRSRSCAEHDSALYPRARVYICEWQEHVTNTQTRVPQDEEGRARAEGATHAPMFPSKRYAVALLRRVIQSDVDI